MAEGEPVAILSETQSLELDVHLTELALQALGARAYHVAMPTPPKSASVPVRSTGVSDALQGLAPAVAALAGSGLVAELTVEGLLHALALRATLKGGVRVLMISNEHSEALERLEPNEGLKDRVRVAVARCREATKMTKNIGRRQRFDGKPGDGCLVLDGTAGHGCVLAGRRGCCVCESPFGQRTISVGARRSKCRRQVCPRRWYDAICRHDFPERWHWRQGFWTWCIYLATVGDRS